ncbi:hypothetical protein [Agrobacterium vaccinii]|uniref:hypothetical protein n=1 Tax=Agrobacterium vaccinii TaxID=2735528 RepID=UPI001E601123|nr:hypothetical protein [Agrobacterium vaccinii]UHS56810.1 hypothetical protein HRS00_08345 [Agrobacterium vaccinii]
MPETDTKLTALQVENGRALVDRLRSKPDDMVDFAAWVVEKMWLSLVQQSDVVTLEMNEALHRSGFNRDFLDRNLEPAADILHRNP